MASSLSYFGFDFEKGDDVSLLAEIASDTTLGKEERTMALMIAIYFRAISFGKAEQLMQEMGLVENTFETFEKYIKRYTELKEQS